MSFYSPFSNQNVYPTYQGQQVISNTYEQPVVVSSTNYNPPVTVYGQAAVYQQPKNMLGKRPQQQRWF
jgi:hypothetical protein